jgi:hypothetical protein
MHRIVVPNKQCADLLLYQCHKLMSSVQCHVQNTDSGFEECARVLLTDDRAGKVNAAVSGSQTFCSIFLA